MCCAKRWGAAAVGLLWCGLSVYSCTSGKCAEKMDWVIYLRILGNSSITYAILGLVRINTCLRCMGLFLVTVNWLVYLWNI